MFKVLEGFEDGDKENGHNVRMVTRLYIQTTYGEPKRRQSFG